MAHFSVLDFACSVVSLHEQLLGAHNFINRARDSDGLLRGYQLLARLPRDYLTFVFLPFDAASIAIYDELLTQNLRLGTMDLRIAAIALSRDLTVLTRNHRDFSRVAGLKIEDRTGRGATSN
ncbi:MAG: PilT protein domain protein [Planctomycetaceae bacterium]|nr:PilT protein domain protein [Planctomycetaceae bacterium]